MKKLKAFFISHQPQFLLLLVFFVFLYFSSELPYLGLVLDKKVIFYLLWIIIIFVFKVSGRFSIKAALAFFLFCLPLLMLKREKSAEGVGNLATEFLWVGVIQELAGLLRGKEAKD